MSSQGSKPNPRVLQVAFWTSSRQCQQPPIFGEANWWDVHAAVVMKGSSRPESKHVQYSKQMTHSVITEEIEKILPKWQALALSKASYKRKLLAIKTVAWPNLLHGIASAYAGTL